MTIMESTTATLNIGIQIITPDVAKQFLEMNASNRKLSPGHVARLASDMANGRWVATASPITFDVDGRLIDGQHRLQAVIDSGASITCIVARNASPEVQEVTDIGRQRSIGDSMTMAAIGNAQLLAATAKALILLSRSEDGLALSTLDATGLSRQEILDYVRRHTDMLASVAISANYIYKACPNITRAGWATAMCITRNHPRSEEFYAGVISGALLPVGDPRLAIRNMRHTSLKGARPYAQALTLAPPWNAFLAGAPHRRIFRWTPETAVKTFRSCTVPA